MKNLLKTIFVVLGILDSSFLYPQSNAMDWSERLLNSTVRIEAQLSGGRVSTGTGYYFSFNVENGLPVVITNKHVVAGASKIRFYLKEKSAEGRPDYSKTYFVEIASSAIPIIPHPDPTVDLCVIPAVFIEGQANILKRTMYVDIGSEKAIPSQEVIDNLLAIESIYMIGYPNGIWDSKNNLPVVRKGLTATNPAIDYEGRKEFLIDIAAFPGSSGSPIFLYDPGPYQTKTSIQLGGRIFILGTLYAGPLFDVEGKIVRHNPSLAIDSTSSTLLKIPMNLGYVIKAERILDFKPILIEMHEKMKASK